MTNGDGQTQTGQQNSNEEAHKRNVQEKLEAQTHTVTKDETLYDICRHYGIGHLDFIIDANKTFFEELDSQENKDKPYGDALKEGDQLTIPPLIQSLAVATRAQDDPPHYLQVRPFDAVVPISYAWAKRQAMDLALAAYLSVEKKHKGSIKSFLKHSVSEVWWEYRIDFKANVTVLGAMLAGIAVAALVPYSLPAMMAIAAGGYAVKKIVGQIAQHRRHRRLLSYWEGDLFTETTQEETDSEDQSEDGTEESGSNREEEEQKVEQDANADSECPFDKVRAQALSTDAQFTLRRAVVHMRKARELLETPIVEVDEEGQSKTVSRIEALLKHNGEFTSCKEMMDLTKYGFKFIHEVDKLQNFLLPAMVHLIFFIDAHEEYAKHWQQVGRGYEKPIIHFFQRGDHSRCKQTSKFKFWDKDRYCILEAGDYKKRKKRLEAYVDYETGFATALGKDHQTNEKLMQKVGQKPEDTPVAFNLADAREVVEHCGRNIQNWIRENREWTGWAQPRPETESGQTEETQDTNEENQNTETETENESENVRYTLFKRDYMKYYDHPYWWRQVKHKWTNWSMRKSKAEKSSAILDEGFNVGGGVVGGPLIGHAFKPLIDGAGLMTWKGAGYMAGKVGSKSGIPLTQFLVVTCVYNPVTGAGKGEKHERKSLLLPLDQARVQQAIDEGLQDEKLRPPEDENYKQYKEGAINLDVLFKSIARHYKNAHDVLEKLNAELDELKQPDGKVVLPDICAVYFEYAKRLYEFHHEFDKMEKHMVALFSFVGDLMSHVIELKSKEQEIKDKIDEIVKPWLEKDFKTHQKCKEKSKFCYGPAIDIPNAGPLHPLRGSTYQKFGFVSITGIEGGKGQYKNDFYLGQKATVKVQLEPPFSPKTPSAHAYLLVTPDGEEEPIIRYNVNLRKQVDYEIDLRDMHDELLNLLISVKQNSGEQNENQEDEQQQEEQSESKVVLNLSLEPTYRCQAKTDQKEEKLGQEMIINVFEPEIYIDDTDRDDDRYFEGEPLQVHLVLDPPYPKEIKGQHKAEAALVLKNEAGDTEISKSDLITFRNSTTAEITIPSQINLWEENQDYAVVKKGILAIDARKGCQVPQQDKEVDQDTEYFATYPIFLNHGKRQVVALESLKIDDEVADECCLRKTVQVELKVSQPLDRFAKVSADLVLSLLADDSAFFTAEPLTIALHESKTISSKVLKEQEKAIREKFKADPQSRIQLKVVIKEDSLVGCSVSVREPERERLLLVKNEYEPKLKIEALDPEDDLYVGDEVKVKLKLEPPLSASRGKLGAKRPAEVKVTVDPPGAPDGEYSDRFFEHKNYRVKLSQVGALTLTASPNEDSREGQLTGPGCSIERESACQRSLEAQMRFFQLADLNTKKTKSTFRRRTKYEISFKVEVQPPNPSQKAPVRVTVKDMQRNTHYDKEHAIARSTNISFSVENPGSYLVRLQSLDTMYSVDANEMKTELVKPIRVE